MSDEQNDNEDGSSEDTTLSMSEYEELTELADSAEDNAAIAAEAVAKAELLQTQLDEANARAKAGTGSKAPAVKSSPVKATFIRDTFDYEVSAGESGYKKGQKVTFSSEGEYERWHRRGACETAVDTAAREKAEQIKQDADEEAARG